MVVAAILLVTVAPMAAQSPFVTAEVDCVNATTDEVITLSVIVEGVNQASPPQLPFLDGLVLVGSSSVYQYSFTNGKAVSNFLFEYRLVATRTGKIMIDSIVILVDGDVQRTAPIELEVTQGVGSLVAPTPALNFDFDPDTVPSTLAEQDHFVEAGVDDPNPYLGQQLTYFRKYYVARDPVRDTLFTRRSSTPPSFDGFWHRELSDEGRYEVEAAGRRYTVYEERTVLFPSLVGRVIIDSSVTGISTSPLRPPQELVTGAVRVDVRSLPAGAPAGFTGAVGRYRIEATVDSDRLSGDDPATLSVTISGTGNIDALPEPSLPKTGDWRHLSQDSDVSSQVFQGELRGSKIFNFLLLPNTDGALEIPSIGYVYFDPERETYVTMTTEPIRVEVEPGSVDIIAVQEVLEETEDAPDLKVVDSGRARGLKPVEGTLSTRGKGFAAPVWYWSLFAIPVLLLVVVEAYGSRFRLGRVLDAVRSARAKPSQAEPFRPGRSPDVRLLDHLSGLLQRPASGLAGDRLAWEIDRLGADASLISDVRRVLDTGHEARFAPPGMRTTRSHDNDEDEGVEDLIRRLNEALQ